MTAVRPRTKWVYVGGEEGYGLVFTVGHIEGTEVNAWSDIEQGSEYDHGFAWASSRALFLRSFEPLGFPEEMGV